MILSDSEGSKDTSFSLMGRERQNVLWGKVVGMHSAIRVKLPSQNVRIRKEMNHYGVEARTRTENCI